MAVEILDFGIAKSPNLNLPKIELEVIKALRIVLKQIPVSNLAMNCFHIVYDMYH